MNTANNELETNAVIKHNGNIILFKSLITDVTCNMNLIDFPFDQVFLSYHFVKNKVIFCFVIN